MARNREALILLIDVGPTMHSVLPEVEKVCSMLVQKRLIFRNSDQVGIVLFGTAGIHTMKNYVHHSRFEKPVYQASLGPDTNNELEKEVGGYEHVVVLRDIRVVDGGAVESLQNLPRGTVPGDYAIVVGTDMMIKKFGYTDKQKKFLYLISDAQYPTKEPYEGTKEDQVDTISEMMKAHGIRLNLLIFRENLCGAEHLKAINENDRLLNQFSRKLMAKLEHVDSATSLLGAVKTRKIHPVTVFRGDLELSSALKIKVWVFKKTSEEKFPTLKKYSDKAPKSDKFATHEIKVDYEYKSIQDPDKVVPPEQRIRGYRYGPQVVPISSAEWETVKFKPEKGVKLLGFTDASNILRHTYMKDVYIFIPEPGNKKAIIAVSALARAMKEMNTCAILRCVWRQGQGNVVVGTLTPNLSSIDNIPDSFYFNILPFAEDVREFQFPSFSRLPSTIQPDEQQQAAADDFVRMLDLAPSDGKEVLQPDYTPNPVLERFYHFLELKSKNPELDVPQLDRSLKRIAEHDPDILLKHKSTISNFAKQFELKENPKKKKSSGRAHREKPSASNEEEVGLNYEIPEIQSASMVKALPSTEVEKIEDSNPIRDFEAMMARRDSSKWISKAIKDLQNYVVNLLESSSGKSSYPKAIEYLRVLRKGCILEQEPKEFNQFLLDMCKKFHATDQGDFLELISSENIAMISKSEAADSDLTEEEAKILPVKTEKFFE